MSGHYVGWPNLGLAPMYCTRFNKLMIGGNINIILASPSLEHMTSSHPSSGGHSGIKSQSAPDAKADTKARYLIKKIKKGGISYYTSHIFKCNFRCKKKKTKKKGGNVQEGERT